MSDDAVDFANEFFARHGVPEDAVSTEYVLDLASAVQQALDAARKDERERIAQIVNKLLPSGMAEYVIEGFDL